MRCSIQSIRHIELSGNRVGSRIEGFIPLQNMDLIAPIIADWVKNYRGIKPVMYNDGIFVASWAETTCAEQDSYDYTVGSHIAESRAKAKIYRFIRNMSEHLSDYFSALANEYEDAYLKYDHCVDHELDHCDLLGNEGNN